jgi:hypothetical protein
MKPVIDVLEATKTFMNDMVSGKERLKGGTKGRVFG